MSKTGVAIQLSGGVGGPDGIKMDAENGLLVCHLGVGVWRFDANMLPTHLIHSEDHRHHHLSNVAYGGPDIGLLCAAGKVRRVIYPFCSLDTIALEPHFRVARQSGAVSTLEL
ncbi:MAG: hypothetical protein ACXW2I_07445, partial [Burkholderiales bacterium]